VAEKGNTPAVDDSSAIAACAALWNAAGPEQKIQEKSTGLQEKFTLAAL